MLKEIKFNNTGCAEAYHIAFDYMAIVEKIQTWNVSNDLNLIDNTAQPDLTMTEEDKKKFTFCDEIGMDQKYLKSEGQIRLGKNRRALIHNRSFGNEILYEGYHTWVIQAKNKQKEWYTSDVITIHSAIHSEDKSCHSITIKSNSRDIAEQISKPKFPIVYGAPVLYKYGISGKPEKLEVDCVAIDHHRWHTQEDLIDLGATFSGSGKIIMTIPKGKNDDGVIKIMKTLRNMYKFDSQASQDDANYYIDTSTYVFNKAGLTLFYEQCKEG